MKMAAIFQICNQLTLAILCVHLVSSIAVAYRSTAPSPKLLYGNVLIGSSHGEISVGKCEEGEPLYLDYSFMYQSVVAVCHENHKAVVRIFPIQKS